MGNEIKRIKPVFVYMRWSNEIIIAVPSLYSRRLVRKLTKTNEFKDLVYPWRIKFESIPVTLHSVFGGCLKKCWPEINVPVTDIEGNYFVTKSSWIHNNRNFVRHEILATAPENTKTDIDIINALWKVLQKARRGKWSNCGIVWCNRLYI